MTRFKYNNEIYQTWNLKKELKKMGITKNDIEIIPEVKEQKVIEEADKVKLYKFKNIYNNIIRYSIYNNLNDLIWNPITKTGLRDFNIEEWVLIE